MPLGPRLLDREFLEKLERLAIHWQKSFPGLVGGHNASRFAGAGPGVSGPSQFPSRRRSAGRQLARLPAAGKIVPEDVPGGAARARAPAARHQRLHDGPRRREVRLRAAAGGGAVLRGPGAARQHRDPPVSRAAWRGAFARTGGRHRFPAGDGCHRRPGGRRVAPITWRWCASSSTLYSQRGLVIVISDFLDDQRLRAGAPVSGRFRP